MSTGLAHPERPAAPGDREGEADARLAAGIEAYERGRPADAAHELNVALALFAGCDDGEGRLRTLLALVRVRRDAGELDAAATACDQALALARALDKSDAEADALNLRACVCAALGDHPAALERLQTALAIARTDGLKEREANVLSNLGTLHTMLGDHPRALEHLRSAYDVVRAIAPGTRSEATNLVALGRLYLEMGDADGAAGFFERGREVGALVDDAMTQAAALNNLANIRSAEQDWAAARELFQQALGIARAAGLRQYEIDNLDGLGQVHAALHEHDAAIEVHRHALEVSRRIGDHEGEMDALLNLGRDHLAMEAAAQAIAPLQACLALADRTGRDTARAQAHACLADAFERTGDLAAALHHHRAFHRSDKAVFNERNARETRTLAVQFDLERARHEAETYRLRTEITQRAREEAEAEVRERTRELEEAQLEVVARLAIAAEHRDDDTGEHARRVGRNAATIARALAWPEDDAQLLQAAAPLHDVGKIGIRDAVLLKPGKLTREEFELMQAHATIGARILSGGRSRLLRMAEEIALAHHERWDGNGYPLGLAGDDVPIAARIVAVADVLDALTHARPYKAAWPLSDALAEIRRQSGRQFDPRVVDACVRVLDQLEL